MSLLDSPPHVVQVYPRAPASDVDGNSGWVEDTGTPIAWRCWVNSPSSTRATTQGALSVNGFRAIGRPMVDPRLTDPRALEGARVVWGGRTFIVDGRELRYDAGIYVRHVTLALLEATG